MLRALPFRLCALHALSLCCAVLLLLLLLPPLPTVWATDPACARTPVGDHTDLGTCGDLVYARDDVGDPGTCTFQCTDRTYGLDQPLFFCEQPDVGQSSQLAQLLETPGVCRPCGAGEAVTLLLDDTAAGTPLSQGNNIDGAQFYSRISGDGTVLVIGCQ